ncbi:MAG: hypothetical protein IJJ52_03835 [Lachnospiraceae bacterium]|nr:hypothetical protein [Lachnospiraceae bacterium]
MKNGIRLIRRRRLGVLLFFIPLLLFSLNVKGEEQNRDSIPGEQALGKEEAEEEDTWEEVLEVQKGIRQRKILKYGMTPVYGQDIADGVYSVEAVSDSKYFKIAEARLTVDGGTMSAQITIPSMSYLYVYPGTKKEAASDEAHRIGFSEADGQTVFTIPVEALNKEIDCAAFSKARNKWYDRKLVFNAATLPKEAVGFPVPDYDLIADAVLAYGTEDEEYLSQLAAQSAGDTGKAEDEDPDANLLTGTPEPVEVEYPDGEYSIEVNMLGGSGRASISSPTLLVVRDGRAYARLLWSSSYYDYMIIGDQTFYNQTKDGGNSTFEIPIVTMDETFPVIADTTAMGEPVEIRYELSFYSMTVGPKGNIPQEAAKKVLLLAAIILSVLWILNFIVKRKRKA